MKIIPLQPDTQDERGFTTEFDQPRAGTQLLLYRNAGIVSGRHYHKGLSPNKNPEILILIQGRCTVNWYDIHEPENRYSQSLTGPVRLEVPVYTWHEIVTETDCVFIELNSIAEHVADTFYIKQ